ncbi:hypothetical protein E2C01_019247 [Portunus trituberculatus]|uniref:Uncharacterized protein n=1 Tax=Portunus trituberculatus TaxID=210409 RepID=A0A5B7DXR4_PORTR|nr:hypothetical protein [Portunus trituberculatus]
MSPVLASPFKSPIAVLAKIKQWSSSRRCHRDDPVPTASPIHAQNVLQQSDSADMHCSDPCSTPQLNRSYVVTTPDSGVHTGPLLPRLSGAGSPSSVLQGSSPIPITGNTPTSNHSGRLRAIKEALNWSKLVFSKDDHPYVTHKQEFQSQKLSCSSKDTHRPSVTSLASSAISFVTTTTTTLLSENSCSDSSEYGESWCLKLSDLDSPACLSPRSSGWRKLVSESEKFPSKPSSEVDEKSEGTLVNSEEYVVVDKLRQNVGSSEGKEASCSADFGIVQVMKVLFM